MKKKSKKVPKEMQDIYLSITKITDEFSQQYLNDEYAEFIQDESWGRAALSN